MITEVSLIAILDADKEGYLRSETSLIQTIGRAARNVNGMVIMYADNVTKSMKIAVDETNRRRLLQIEYNKKNDIIPKTIVKNISDILNSSGIVSKTKKLTQMAGAIREKKVGFNENQLLKMNLNEIFAIISSLEEEMNIAARNLEFEKAAAIRDKIRRIKKLINLEPQPQRKSKI